jgi:putative selenate reductase
LDSAIESVARRFPEVRTLDIPRRLSSKVTLSTMHGCPPEEIASIAEHLMESWGLHTSVKLNPTLLGAGNVRRILGDELGFSEVVVPDSAFEHDPGYDEAVDLIRDLQATAGRCGLDFGVKLSNTLEVENHRTVFDAEGQNMYLSGRPLHALVVRLAHRLCETFEGELQISFAGGADAFNFPNLLAAGLRPVTTCSDLLRPGGYLRLHQYLDNLRAAMDAVEATDLDALVRRTAGSLEPADHDLRSRTSASARQNLSRYADAVLTDPLLMRDRFDRAHTKTRRPLGSFDCIVAPCTDACPVDQKVPEYMRQVAAGDLQAAAATVFDDNPLGSILGRACHHPCESPCLRTHLDDPLAIREIKRFITEQAPPLEETRPGDEKAARVAIVGGGPCGLAAATFLARSGIQVTIFEARAAGGGMVSGTIPGFRASQAAIDRDLRRVESLGVEFRYRRRVGTDVTMESLRDEGFRYIVVAAGAQRGRRLGIPGETSTGVWDGLVFLRAVRSSQLTELGGRIGVVGGGDVAVDCARSAARLGADEVTVLYRRGTAEMPALGEELAGLREEGIPVEELASPTSIIAAEGRIEAVRCIRNRLGEPGPDGRRTPEPIPGSEFELRLDGLIVAIGQRPDLSLFGGEEVAITSAGYLRVDPESSETSIPGVFAGGDVTGSGPATIVEAVGDGRRIARAICSREGGVFDRETAAPEAPDLGDTFLRRATRLHRVAVPHAPAEARQSFQEVVRTLSPKEAEAEAGRCLDCDLLCSTCDSVCPNRAIFTYQSSPFTTELPRLHAIDGDLKPAGAATFSLRQQFQVAVLADLCNECGNCTTFCPTAGRPHRDKPRLYLDRASFEAETDNAFMVSRRGASWVAHGRFGGSTHGLVVDEEEIRYAAPGVSARLDPTTFRLVEGKTAGDPPPGRETTLVECAILFALLCGIRDSMPGFPIAETTDDTEL